MVLKIVLDDNPFWSYYPGQTISGNVVVTKNIWHKVEGLTLRFLGKMEFGNSPPMPPQDALPQSYQDRSNLMERIRKVGSMQEILLDHKMSLLHSWKVLKPGSHEFPFSFTLPDELPESITLSGFRIFYEFVTVLKRPRDDYKVYQTPFQILRNSEFEQEGNLPEDLSSFSDRFDKKTEDTLGFCLCCSRGKFTVEFKLTNRIARIGHDLNFSLEIWNETRSLMDRAKVVLIREFRHKKGLACRRKEMVSELSGRTTPSGGHEIWSSFFRIPNNTPPTNFIRRETYEINYILKALVHPIDQPNKAIKIKCPVLVIRAAEMCSATEGDSAAIDTEDTDVRNLFTAVPPPPTYEEAMCMDNSSNNPLIIE